jgi:acyl-CoA synthetase (AMP-forming)/AMP-acid ligase II
MPMESNELCVRVGTLGQALLSSLKANSEQICVSDGSKSLTYADILQLAEAAAGQLGTLYSSPPKARIRVGLCASNSPEALALLIGILIAGMTPFLLDPAMSDHEIEVIERECNLDALIYSVTSFPDSATNRAHEVLGHQVVVSSRLGADHVSPLLESTEICRFTSGSTRAPGCIEFSGTAVINAARAWLASSKLSARDVVLCFAGMYNGLAFNTSVIPGLLAGSTLVLPKGLPSGGYVARLIDKTNPTVLVGFPALYESLARSSWEGQAPRLRLALSSASRLSPQTASQVRTRWMVPISDYYGVAELGPLTFDSDPDQPGQGTPLDGVEFRFSDSETNTGEIRVRSSSMGSRYLNYPGAFEERIDSDGFYATGDEGRLSDGRLILEGRTGKDLNIGGRKFTRDEVESVLRSIDGVTDARAMAVVRRDGSAMLAAAIESSVVDLDKADITAHCRRSLPAHKVPEAILHLSAFPRGSTGKVKEQSVQQLLQNTITPEPGANPRSIHHD